jgi:NAD(P)-dependent dehydrogenase (short-subunit alcohol dehydrogenase family)
MGRLDGTVDVAAAWGKTIALFLASEESRMIAGAAIPADGGSSAY